VYVPCTCCARAHIAELEFELEDTVLHDDGGELGRSAGAQEGVRGARRRERRCTTQEHEQRRDHPSSDHCPGCEATHDSYRGVKTKDARLCLICLLRVKKRVKT
jgi:hypothetical protein